MDIELPDMKMHVVHLTVGKDSVTLTQGGQSPALDETTKKELRENANPFPELNFFKEGYTTELTSIKNLEGTDAYEVKVTGPAGRVHLYYYSVETGLRIREVKHTSQGETSTEFGDYREVSGIKFPWHIDDNQGQVDLDMKVTSVKVNSGLTAADMK